MYEGCNMKLILMTKTCLVDELFQGQNVRPHPLLAIFLDMTSNRFLSDVDDTTNFITTDLQWFYYSYYSIYVRWELYSISFLLFFYFDNGDMSQEDIPLYVCYSCQ